MTQRDGEWLYKEWWRNRGEKIEDEAILRILVAFRTKDKARIAEAVRYAMDHTWDASWAAAGGDNDPECLC